MADKWICNDAVNIVDGNGYGLTDNLQTFYIGTEAEILTVLGGSENCERVRINLHRAGAYGEVGLEQESDGISQDEGIAMSARKPNHPILSRSRRSRVVKPVRGKAHTRKA